MKAPNAQQLAAIETLQRNGAWREFVAWLGENHQRASESCVRADDEIHIRRLQGEARCLGEIVGMLTAKK